MGLFTNDKDEHRTLIEWESWARQSIYGVQAYCDILGMRLKRTERQSFDGRHARACNDETGACWCRNIFEKQWHDTSKLRWTQEKIRSRILSSQRYSRCFRAFRCICKRDWWCAQRGQMFGFDFALYFEDKGKQIHLTIYKMQSIAL